MTIHLLAIYPLSALVSLSVMYSYSIVKAAPGTRVLSIAVASVIMASLASAASSFSHYREVYGT